MKYLRLMANVQNNDELYLFADNFVVKDERFKKVSQAKLNELTDEIMFDEIFIYSDFKTKYNSLKDFSLGVPLDISKHYVKWENLKQMPPFFEFSRHPIGNWYPYQCYMHNDNFIDLIKSFNIIYETGYIYEGCHPLMVLLETENEYWVIVYEGYT